MKTQHATTAIPATLPFGLVERVSWQLFGRPRTNNHRRVVASAMVGKFSFGTADRKNTDQTTESLAGGDRPSCSFFRCLRWVGLGTPFRIHKPNKFYLVFTISRSRHSDTICLMPPPRRTQNARDTRLRRQFWVCPRFSSATYLNHQGRSVVFLQNAYQTKDTGQPTNQPVSTKDGKIVFVGLDFIHLSARHQSNQNYLLACRLVWNLFVISRPPRNIWGNHPSKSPTSSAKASRPSGPAMMLFEGYSRTGFS